jgi:FKBP-type peptidyl-prolyl cis-trans isomerase FkpA
MFKEQDLKTIIASLAAALALAGCANAPETKTAAAAAAPAPAPVAKKECTPPPRELVMKDITVGTGKEVALRSPTFVEYTGWLYDGCAPEFKGAKFDSSVGRTTPFGFVVGAGRVIKGWDEGVMGMKEKGKRLLIIPPDKAYGAQGAGNGLIPPDSTLVFEVSVLNIMTP